MGMLTEIYLANAIDIPASKAPVSIGIKATDGSEILEFPVEVFDTNMISRGFANNKQEFIDLWNLYNANIGHLNGDYNPFSFILFKNKGPLPSALFGNDGYLVRIEELAVLIESNQIIFR